jgi:hypothetical protein
MNTPQKIIGIVLQCVAVILFVASTAILCASMFPLLRLPTGSTVTLHLDLASYLFPFPLWFLGSEVRRGSGTAIRVTIAAMIYLSFIGVVSLAFLLFSGVGEHLVGNWKTWAYAFSVAFIVIPVFCIYGLRKRSIA